MNQMRWIGRAADVAIGVAGKTIHILYNPTRHSGQVIGTEQRTYTNPEEAATAYADAAAAGIRKKIRAVLEEELKRPVTNRQKTTCGNCVHTLCPKRTEDGGCLNGTPIDGTKEEAH